MNNVKRTSKMFLDIVGELRQLITEQGIQIGDKLPSERVLAEQLNVGRSSVREALRSLELLGIIETRRGEGTFLADFKKHQLVEVLSTFIMQQPHSFLDVQKTRMIHEKAAIRIVCRNASLRTLPVWKSLQSKLIEEGTIRREDIIREMMIATGNRLALKIWFLLKQYSRAPFDEMTTEEEKTIVLSFLHHLMIANENEALNDYMYWMEQVERGEQIDT